MQSRRQKRLFAVLTVLGLLAGAVAAMLYAMQQNIDLLYTT
jgi:cytochrome c-type biogenesis protein CcmE